MMTALNLAHRHEIPVACAHSRDWVRSRERTHGIRKMGRRRRLRGGGGRSFGGGGGGSRRFGIGWVRSRQHRRWGIVE